MPPFATWSPCREYAERNKAQREDSFKRQSCTAAVLISMRVMPMILTNEFRVGGGGGDREPKNPVWMPRTPLVSVCTRKCSEEAKISRTSQMNCACEDTVHFQKVINAVESKKQNQKTFIYFPVIDSQTSVSLSLSLSYPHTDATSTFYNNIQQDTTTHGIHGQHLAVRPHQAEKSRASDCDHFITYGEPLLFLFFSSASRRPEFLIKSSQC